MPIDLQNMKLANIIAKIFIVVLLLNTVICCTVKRKIDSNLLIGNRLSYKKLKRNSKLFGNHILGDRLNLSKIVDSLSSDTGTTYYYKKKQGIIHFVMVTEDWYIYYSHFYYGKTDKIVKVTLSVGSDGLYSYLNHNKFIKENNIENKKLKHKISFIARISDLQSGNERW